MVHRGGGRDRNRHRQPQPSLTDWIYRVSAIMLLAVAVLTAVTGARTPVIFFKICPFLLATSAGLLLAASWK